jgi:hypothetical protein
VGVVSPPPTMLYHRLNSKAYLRQTFSSLITKCDADDESSIKEFCSHFTKIEIVIIIRFYGFSIYAAIRRNSVPVYNGSGLCIPCKDHA